MACMWGQAVLAEDEKTYFARLDILTKSYSKENPLSGQVGSARNELRSKGDLQKCDGKNQLLLSIRPFLDGLLLYHIPRKTSLYKDKVDQKLSRQNAQVSSKYVTNASITEKHTRYFFNKTRQKIPYTSNRPLNKIFDKLFIGKKKDYQYIFSSIMGACQDLEVPCFVLVSSKEHAIGLKATSDGRIKLYDVSRMSDHGYLWSRNIQQIEDLCEYMFLSLFVGELYNGPLGLDSGPLRLDIQVYVKPEYNSINFQPMNRLIIGVIRRNLDRYGSRGVFQWHHHKSRAKSVSGKLGKMKLLDNVKRYLESEQRGVSIKKYAPPTSNNNSSMKDKSPEGDYANIIYDGIQLAEKYKNAS
ncbi:MAG: hypothetical protein GY710_00440, partial [Desulfobacteraceae bacterium]|nr:hypothetical protein [Desulfobacteraceae bacterium]